MIARLRERSPRGRIARQGLLALVVTGLLVAALFIFAAVFASGARVPGHALWLLPALLLGGLAWWVPLGRPRCPGCGYRFTRFLQYAAMINDKPSRRIRHCPHCGVDLAPGEGPA